VPDATLSCYKINAQLQNKRLKKYTEKLIDLKKKQYDLHDTY